jgi:hypothetical protein
MKFLARILGVILVGGALIMLATFWEESRHDYTSYIRDVEQQATVAGEVVATLKARHAPQDLIDAAMLEEAKLLNHQADAMRDQRDSVTYWRKFYALCAGAIFLGLLALYAGFRKPRAAVAV